MDGASVVSIPFHQVKGELISSTTGREMFVEVGKASMDADLTRIVIHDGFASNV